VITFAIYLKVRTDPAGYWSEMQATTHRSRSEGASPPSANDRPAIVQYGKYMERLCT